MFSTCGQVWWSARYARKGRCAARGCSSRYSPARSLDRPRTHLQEDALHRVDLREIHPDIVVAAALAGGEAELAPRVGIARCSPAEMDDRSEILLLLARGLGDAMALERLRDAPVEQ